MEAVLAIVAVIVGIILALGAGWFVLLGSLYVWPMTLILIVLGGFVGGGPGAIAGWIVSGLVGLFLIWRSNN